MLGFTPDGRALGVSVDLPPGSDPWAHACVENAFRAARVPAFTGDQPVTLTRAFFVR